MYLKTMLSAATFGIFLLAPTSALAQTPRKVSIKVEDELGKPVEGVTIRARYLETVRQSGKEYRVPMELAAPLTTDSEGKCELILRDVTWSLAGVEAHYVEMTSDETDDLYDCAPKDPMQLKAFEGMMDDWGQRYRTAFTTLRPDVDAKEPITLKLLKSIKLTGFVQVGGRPLAKGQLTIYSQKTDIDQLFPRSSPFQTDESGGFSFYAIPGTLDRVQILVRRADGNRVLDLKNVVSKPTPDGRMYKIQTHVDDYELAKH